MHHAFLSGSFTLFLTAILLSSWTRASLPKQAMPNRQQSSAKTVPNFIVALYFANIKKHTKI
jgi:hypothetical protein